MSAEKKPRTRLREAIFDLKQQKEFKNLRVVVDVDPA